MKRTVMTRKIVLRGRQGETSPWKCRERLTQENNVTEHGRFGALREVFDGRVFSRGLWVPPSPD